MPLNPDLATNQYRLTMTDFERFWKAVQHKKNGCAVYPRGVFRVPRTVDCEEKRIRGEYVSWVYHFDAIQDGADVVVTCGTTNCINPHHLQKLNRDKPEATVKGFSHRAGDRPSKFHKVRVGNKMIPAFYISQEWKQLRRDVVERDKGICQYCGDSGSQADHILARGQGGLDVLQNLVCCCADCNAIANGRRFDSFDAKKDWILQRKAVAV